MGDGEFEPNILEFEIHNQILERVDSQEVVNKNHNIYKCRFTFEKDSEWYGLNKFVIFTDAWNNRATQHLGRNGNVNICKIPDNVLKGSYFKISVYAGDLMTTNNVSVLLTQSGYKKHNPHLHGYPNHHYHPDPRKPHLYNPHPYHRNFHTGYECEWRHEDDKDLWVEIFDNFNTMIDSIIYDNKTLHFFNKDYIVESIYLPFVEEEDFPDLVNSLVEEFININIEPATSEKNGLLSKEDKIKLDSIDLGANKIIVDDSLSLDSNNPVMNNVITTALNGKEDSYDFVERMDNVIQDLIENGE